MGALASEARPRERGASATLHELASGHTGLVTSTPSAGARMREVVGRWRAWRSGDTSAVKGGDAGRPNEEREGS